jgi:hypothetical protein
VLTTRIIGITDQVAKESKDSNASTHEHHQVDTGASSGGLGAEQARAAHKSPVCRLDYTHKISRRADADSV